MSSTEATVPFREWRVGGSVVALVAALAIGLAGQASKKPSPLPSKARSQLKKAFTRLARAKDDGARDELLPAVYTHGLAGVRFIEKAFARRKEYAGLLEQIKKEAPHRLGLDILKKKVQGGYEWSPTPFVFGEVVLVKKGSGYAGFRVLDSSAVDAGRIDIEWWHQTALNKKLTQPGAPHGRKTVNGRRPARALFPQSGYTEFEFDLDLDGVAATIRFLGPITLTHAYGKGAAFCLTGASRPGTLTASKKGLRFVSSPPNDLRRAAVLLQEYLFRIVPGCEPLPLGEAEKSEFAGFEQVQILPRQSRLTAKPFIMIRFLEPDQVQLSPYHPEMILAFLRELIDIDPMDVVIMGGVNTAPQANRFYAGGRWSEPSKKLVKKVLAFFPEHR